MSAIVGSSALAAASTNARGLGFKTSAPMGARKSRRTTPASRRATSGSGALRVVAGNDQRGRPVRAARRGGARRHRGEALQPDPRQGHRAALAGTSGNARAPLEPRRVAKTLDGSGTVYRKRVGWIDEPDFAFRIVERLALTSTTASDPRVPSPPFPGFTTHTTGHLRLLQGDRRGRQGSPEPDPHGEEQRREARLPRVSARLEDCFSAEKESLPDRKRKEGVDGILLTRASPGEASHAGTERRAVAYRERERAAAREERSN